MRAPYFILVFALINAFGARASAQPKQGAPTQTSPTRDNRNVGPQRGAGDDPGARGPIINNGGEPTVLGPADPLAVPEVIGERIGSDYDNRPPPAEGKSAAP